MADFSKYKLKDYQYWEVILNPKQKYLGRCVVWCKRADALDLADATKEERDELFLVLQEVRAALNKVFQPDWFNYSFLGNETRHLHAHLVPRYAKPRDFMGVTFEDNEFLDTCIRARGER